jgi:hypothetical protein
MTQADLSQLMSDDPESPAGRVIRLPRRWIAAFWKQPELPL